MRAAMVVVAVTCAVALAACGGANEPSTEAAGTNRAGAGGSPTAEDVSFGAALGQVRGHHVAALALFEEGDVEAARVHAGHPIDELLASVQGEVDEHDEDLGDELARALEDVREAVVAESSPSDVADAVARAADVTIEVEETVVGAADDPSYRGSVIAALLGTAAHEYEESVAGGDGIELLAEYQDGAAFTIEARTLYGEIAAEVESASAEEAEEIDAAFETMMSALDLLDPPRRPAPVDEVEAAAELIGHELEETVGAELLERSDPEEVAEEINRLLDEIVAAYEAGDPTAAAELSAEAYLENYEVIEADVIEHAPEVNDELEPLLGAELRRRIDAGAPSSEIESMVRRAKELLDEAVEILEEHEG